MEQPQLEDIQPQVPQNKFVRVLRFVFVKDWKLKLSAIGLAVLTWVLGILL